MNNASICTMTYRMPRLEARKLLFDLDGTLVDSSVSISTIWRAWAAKYEQPFDDVLKFSHGRKAIDTMAKFLGQRDDLNAMSDRFIRDEIQNTKGVRAIAGVQTFLASLRPEDWAIVTSCVRPLAEGRMNAAEMVRPSILITADMLTHGKPHPEGYLRAAREMGVTPDDCIVFEDSVSGLEAAKNAKMRAIFIGRKSQQDVPSIADFTGMTVEYQDDDQFVINF